ncbi:hypothetical protein Ahia01_000982700 [Argonauta hians]
MNMSTAKIINDLNLLFEGGVINVPHGIPEKKRTKEDFLPVVKKTVFYIVAIVLTDESDQVLLIQEAKSSCHGAWYIPAGRVEPGENLVDAAKREFLEETGLELEPTTLLCVEFGSSGWYRFTFTGTIVGGTLKDTSARDSESLQAKWFSFEDIKNAKIKLRAHDFLRLVKLCRRHMRMDPDYRLRDTLPQEIRHNILLLRMIIVNETEGQVRILVKKTPVDHLPIVEASPKDYSIMVPLYYILKDAFGHHKMRPKICGVHNVEHCGFPVEKNDGLCLTCQFMLVSHDNRTLDEMCKDTSYQWVLIDDETVRDRLLEFQAPQTCVTLIDLHSQ